MPTLAFWNVNPNVKPATVAAFALECDADIVILAESGAETSEILQLLNADASRFYFPDIGVSDRLTILTRFQPERSCLIRDTFGVAIRHYQLPLGESFLVVAVHLSSKFWKKTEDQILATTRLGRYIREAEGNVGHTRTVVIGDLNMNPFESGVVGSEGLHAVMDRRIVSSVSRVVHGENCTFFYNPMWSELGDNGPSPPGTYFYNSGSEVNYFWNVFDQVLVRPALLESLSTDSVSVVTHIRGTELLTDLGRPNSGENSDHLPIVCRLSDVQEIANVL
ncbi:MAG TPA: endonuclease/exonuclease/phosphatase family protein [Bryobacteraceae bacterium]|nr:endonuclease/exonuclease/phosphatase family protein [Bryobacteraceae bacterium]